MRQLAAILFADITGYTALMQKDETMAATLLRRFQRKMTEAVDRHNGRIINFYGDGALCIFQNPLEAVHCAIALQGHFREEPPVPVRMGIHSGTVVMEDDKAYGDSVNLASRLESMGIPGAVLLSKKIRDEVKNQPDLTFTSLGRFHFKNVEDPMEVFALANEGIVVPEQKDLSGKINPTSPPRKIIIGSALATALFLFVLTLWLFVLKGRGEAPESSQIEKSIAVLPFKNLSAEEDNHFFCAGVMEAILNHLSRIEGLTVISRYTMEGYRDSPKSIAEIADEVDVATVLEGSVQRVGDQVRISARLILAEKSRQLWSGIYDKQLTDLFAVQSEIAESIAGELAIELTPETKTMLADAPTTNLTAYDAYLRGRENLVKLYFDRRDIHYQKARRNFLEALELDPRLAAAYADLAAAYWMIRSKLHNPRTEASLMDSVRLFCEAALAIESDLPQAHSLLGNYFLWKNEEQRFVEEQMRALEINENYANAYDALGLYYAWPDRGEYEKGINLINKAIQLDPASPWTTGYYMNLAISYAHLNAFEEVEYYGRKVRESGDLSYWNPLVHLYLVQGKYDQAEALANEWRANSPDALRYLAEIEVNHHRNYRKAIDIYKEYEEAHPDYVNFRQRFGLAYWLDGQREKGRELFLTSLAEYEGYEERSEFTYCYDRAGIYATLGDTDRALAMLSDSTCHLQVGLDYYILIDPLFQNLWDNPEFREIVRNRQAEKAAILRKIREAGLKG